MKRSTVKVTPSVNTSARLQPTDAAAIPAGFIDPLKDRSLLNRLHAEANKTLRKFKN